ncbi:MAG: hypothetical protein ACT4QB_09230 [Gammaproteobacteria bacterium]
MELDLIRKAVTVRTRSAGREHWALGIARRGAGQSHGGGGALLTA